MDSSAVREAVNMLARAGAQGTKALDLAAQALAEGLGCRWAGVASLAADGRIVMLSASDGAAALLLGDAALGKTAVAALYEADAPRSCILYGDISARFPRDPLVGGRRVRFLVAARFADAAGKPAGHVFAMDDKGRAADACSDVETRQFLDIVGARVGAEFAAWQAADAAASGGDRLSWIGGGMHVISWEMEPSLRRLSYISSHAETVLGYPSESWYRDGVWVERIHPMDRQRAMAALAVAVNGGRGNEFEFRMTAADGREVWLCGVVAPCDGTACLGGLWIDLTRQKAIQQELSENVQRFRDFAEADTDWFWEMDEQLRFSFLSEQFQDATGIDPAYLIGRDRRQLLAASDSVIDEIATEDDWEQHIRILEAHRPFQNFRHSRPAEDGKRFYLSISGKPVFDLYGNFLGYRGTGTNITEQVRTEKALRESERQLRLQSDRAEEASRAKSEFLANMSHEIRTPLNAILGFSDSMQREILGPIGSTKYKEYATAIYDSGCHLLDLINDVLDLSKIEAGRYVLSRKPVDLTEIIKGCLQITKETAARKSIEVVFDVPRAFPVVSADRRAIKQVVLNLLTNALKYTENGGRVTVSLQLKLGDVTLRVADTGIGIPPEDIGHLTEAFVQGSEEHAYVAHEGTGLGLAITDSLVKMHNGTLSIESEVGVGTCVTVYLPNALGSRQAAG